MGARMRSENSYSEVRYSLVQPSREDAVPIMDHEAIRMFVRKCLPELLQCPFRSRVGGDVVMENSPGAPFENHEYIKDTFA